MYDKLRFLFQGSDHRSGLFNSQFTSIELTLTSKILSGLASGAIAAALFNPTDVLKVPLGLVLILQVRFQADVRGTRYKGVFHAIATIVREEGLIKGLYKVTKVVKFF